MDIDKLEVARSQIEPYFEAGYDLIPISRWDHTKLVAHGKCPLNKGWRTEKPIESVQAAVELLAGNFNVGVRLSDHDFVIDADPRNMDGVDFLGRLARDFDFDLSLYPSVVTGGGDGDRRGRHVYMKLPHPINIRQVLEGYPGLEFKVIKRQVIAAGSTHPDSHRMYKWDGPNVLELLPSLAPERLLDALRGPNNVRNRSGGAVGKRYIPAEIAEMLESLRPEDFRDYETRWWPLMASVHDATGGDAMEEFITWSTGDAEFADHRDSIAHGWSHLTHSMDQGYTYRTFHKFMRDAGAGDRILRPDAVTDFDDVPIELTRFNADKPDHERLGPLEFFNKKYFAVMMGGKFRVGCEDSRSEEDGSRFIAEPEFIRWERPTKHKVNVDSGKSDKDGNPIMVQKTFSTAKAWLEWEHRRKFRRVVFDPSMTCMDDEYNLWTGWAVEPEQGKWDLLDLLIRRGLCSDSDAEYEYVMNWIAYMVKKPWRMPGVAITFSGEKGTGKSTLGKILCALAGRHGMQISSGAHLIGKFNAHLEDCVFMFSDEAIRPKSGMDQATLKALITERNIQIERKGVDVESRRNVLHLMLASNESWVVPASADKGERRYFVSNVSNEFQKNHKFFTALYSQVFKQGGLAAFLYDMLRRDIEGWIPEQIPGTVALLEQKMESFTPVQIWLYDKLQPGSLGTETCGDRKNEWRDGSVRVFQSDLRANFDANCKGANRNLTGMTSIAFNRELAKNLPGIKWRNIIERAFGRTTVQTIGTSDKAYAYEIPRLAMCRAKFAGAMGVDYGDLFPEASSECESAYIRYKKWGGQYEAEALLSRFEVESPREIPKDRVVEFLEETDVPDDDES